MKSSKPKRYVVGRAIRARQVLCIDGAESLGVISLEQALSRAESKNLDLVQFTQDKVPTCKIIDYGKFKYDSNKKKKEQERKQREAEIKLKEIKLRPSIDPNDLEIKARKSREFLSEGCKLKISMMLRGREASLKQVARGKLDNFFDFLSDFELIRSDYAESNRVITVTICVAK